MDKKIILESKLTTHQKIHLSVFLGFPLLILIYNSVVSGSYKLLLLFFLLFFLLMILLLLKKGFFKCGNKLYRALFFIDVKILKKEIDLSNKNKTSILSYTRNQKTAWFSDAKPDFSYSFNEFDVVVLNEKHTQKETIISLKEKRNSEKLIDFLTNSFGLEYEKYKPRFR